MNNTSLETIQALERSKRIADTLNKMSAIFLSNTAETFDKMMTVGMGLIADMVDLDRLNVWRNSRLPRGLCVSQIYRWDRESGGTTHPAPELTGMLYSEFAPRWEKLLSNGESINSPVKLLPEKDLLSARKAVSVFITPIFLKGNFWGFVIFSDHRNERYFDTESAELMRSAAFLSANAIIRAEMEREITQAHRFNQSIIKTAPIGLTIFDENINVIDCNEEILKICGTTKQYYIDHFFEFSPEYQFDGQKSVDSARNLINQVRRTGKKITTEWIHLTDEGETVPCQLTVSCVESNGKFTGLAYAYDLRSTRKMEKEINRAARINQTILNAMPVGLAIFTGNPPRITDCNREMTKMFNAPKHKIIARFFEDFSEEYLPDGQPAYPEALNLMNRVMTGETIRIEWPHKTADGEPVPCYLMQTCVKVENEVIGLAFLYDLRNTRKMEKEISKVARINQAILDNLPVGMAYFDGTQRVTDCNKKLTEMFGATKQHLLERYYEDFTPEFLPDGRKSIDEAYKITNRAINGETVRIEWPHQTASGEPVPCDLTLTHVQDQDEFIGIGFLYDLRDIKKLTTQLEEALKRATAASEAKSTFLSNMSHEIRTPINAIIGMTAIGKSAEDAPHKDYCFEKIENASQHLLGVINDILDMSKIEANKFELSIEEFDFEKMLQRVVNIFAFRADEKKQKLIVHIDNSIPRTLLGDDQRLAQVITNLLGNAIKFTPEEGHIRLDTRFLGREDDEYTIQISVKDSGIGITPEQQDQLFNSFQQAESGTSRRFGGTGLGLVISKNIVELMGGQIELKSKVGLGSTFSFTFKMKRGTKKTPGLSEIGVNWENVKILAVDDDQEVLDYFSETMQGFGKNCDTALSGREALELIGEKGMYNIFFVDWKMPDIDGIKLSKELKALSETPEHTIIIMISAAEWNSVAEEAKKAGVDRFLSKPLFPSSIADAISEAIGINRKNKIKYTDNQEIFKGHKILLAEDVDINREIVVTLITPTLLETDCAENGEEAVSMFKNSPDDYDLILMDVQMPVMDGLDATRKIREIENQEQRKPIPIIAMTANVFREDIDKCLEAGMNDHIGKPLDVDEFFGLLRRYLT